jgi:hypothetical protein
MPSPMVFCYNLIPALPTSPKKPIALAIGAELKQVKSTDVGIYFFLFFYFIDLFFS